jgi:biotin carboxyl carrier protein
MQKLIVTIEGHSFEVELDRISPDNPHLIIRVDGEPVHVIHPDLDTPPGNLEWLVINDRPYEITLDRTQRCIKDSRGRYPVELQEKSVVVNYPSRTNGTVQAPIPGQIRQVLVSPGEEVETGQALLVLEAMKMANEIRAPHGGTVNSIHVAAGDTVARDTLLIEIR